MSWLIIGLCPLWHLARLGKFKGLKIRFFTPFFTKSDGFDMAMESKSCPANEVLICVSLALLSPCPQCCDTLACFYRLESEREWQCVSVKSLFRPQPHSTLSVISGPLSLSISDSINSSVVNHWCCQSRFIKGYSSSTKDRRTYYLPKLKNWILSNTISAFHDVSLM